MKSTGFQRFFKGFAQRDVNGSQALVLSIWEMHPHDFTEALVQQLRSHLNGQRAAPFFLAAARVTELGYKEAGGYYWIVGYQGEAVAWVSRDYFVYHDSVEHFDLDRIELEQRFVKRAR